jgi:IclR family mhp operon transcriptional activator
MVRSLSRGLDILNLLNIRDSATPAELAQELNIPRATVYRLLETMADKNFIYRHSSDNRFRMTDKVRTLSDGFTEEDHMANIARDSLNEITEELVWPVSLATISGIDLIVRENTDKLSPLAVEQFTIGSRMPILSSASGICILAFMEPKARNIVLDTIATANRPQDHHGHNLNKLNELFNSTRQLGYSVHHRQRNVSDMTAIAVPIHAQSRVRGALTLRYARSALPMQDALVKFVPTLIKVAEGLSNRLSIHLQEQLHKMDKMI